MTLKDKKITVVGLARSGVGAANLLARFGALVTVNDKKGEDDLRKFIGQLSPSVHRVFGSHPDDIFMAADMIVVSPGVPSDMPQLARAGERGIPVIGELELAYRIMNNTRPASGPMTRFLGVTGTNGKSTTTALLDFMMKKGGFRTVLGGNIGYALTEEILKTSIGRQLFIAEQRTENKRLPTPDYIVAEISSFQLETIKEFRPQGAVIVNITPDHLDRYHSLKEYGDAKAKIFENQREDDFLVLNRDDPETMKVATEKLAVKNEKPRVFSFSRHREVEGICLRGGEVYCTIPGLPLASPSMPLIQANEIRIKGVHNLENAMAASAMALLAGCPADAVKDSLREFAGLEHRLEFIRELDGVRYYNDSKGTNVAAVMKSIESFPEPVILIAGGRDKAGEFSLLKTLVKEKVKALILIGEAAEKIKKALGDLTRTVMAGELREAVQISRDIAAQGDVVLLSPACASFDMFENFEDRGRQFKTFVSELRA
ncbi:MAG: UDP-N-acetylmuramoyl-L-alanine--D-glutamate ligase [Thermodesulfovibrionales bacterium]|nr:UDP-N-acetylmuramoyl-L-alanine--D-glutamate ligase [Thermodesulfovibrionales bacterium]